MNVICQVTCFFSSLGMFKQACEYRTHGAV
jgi:hypothetical protein